jgi:thiol-disulfide isomerase/thioredoxin
MRNFFHFRKTIYYFCCFLILIFSGGCKEKGLKISVLDGLPESKYVSEIKTALENKTSVAVAFTAEWCPHCRQYKPIFFEVKDELKDKALFLNIDVEGEEGSAIRDRFQVQGIPTTAFIRSDGSVFKLQVGEISKEELIKIANELIESKKRKKGEPIAPFPIEPIKKEEEAKQPQADVPPQELIENTNNKEENKEEASSEQDSTEVNEKELEMQPDDPEPEQAD